MTSDLDHQYEKSFTSSLHTQLSLFMDKLEHHPIYQNDYFNALQESNWCRTSFAIHRANFFYRTELTVKSIAYACAKSAEKDDLTTLILFAEILSEETGGGNYLQCHEILMERAHNLYGQIEFDLKPLLVKQAKNSGLIINETIKYREKIGELSTGSYPRMLGVVMALEHHADKMLRSFRGAFRVNRCNMDIDEFRKNVEVYFNCHVENGVEERHASDAHQCVIKNCNTDFELSEIIYGAEETLKVQQCMWDAMYNRITQIVLSDKGRAIEA